MAISYSLIIGNWEREKDRAMNFVTFPAVLKQCLFNRKPAGTKIKSLED